MDSMTAISVKSISKKYRLFGSPAERFLEALHPFDKKYHREFWALKDVSFEIQKGSTTGIIGKNGSGKTTLLQIISSVMQPTSGTVAVDGKISALLELGAGFNPEFTGRENVVLNGTFLGFSKQEMKERLPLVETFADIGDFFDQPVKIYSSGMYVRLAFAAAIIIEPDILIVDEALAVGDAKFQHKCFAKFNEFKQNGKTILFVTHDTDAIVKHCDNAILIDNGTISDIGKSKEVVNTYLDMVIGRHSPEKPLAIPSEKPDNAQSEPGSSPLELFCDGSTTTDNCINRKSYNKNEHRQGNNKAEMIDYLIVCGNQYDPVVIYSGTPIDFYLKIRFNEAVESPGCGLAVNTKDGITIFGTNSFFTDARFAPVAKSEVIIFKISIKQNLAEGDYFFDAGAAEKRYNEPFVALDRRCDVAHIKVLGKNNFAGLADFDVEYQEVERKSLP